MTYNRCPHCGHLRDSQLHYCTHCGDDHDWSAYHWLCECSIPLWDGIECRACGRKPHSKLASRGPQARMPQ
jgi:hypothetical protein